MNMKTQNKCPDYEDISSFFDGELDSSSPLYAHIKYCEKCQKKLDEYNKINIEINNELRAAVPAGFAQNLIEDLKKIKQKQNDKSKIKPFPYHLLMKVAAILVVSGVVFFIIKGNKVENIVKLNPQTGERLVFLNKPGLSRSNSTLKFTPTRKNALGGNNSIDMQNLMNVSSGNYKGPDYYDFKKTKNYAAFIEPEVSQVWSVDNLLEAEKTFSEFANNLKFTKDKNGNAVAVIKLTKKELAELVRKCKATGFRLVSPAQPQPEQITFLGNKDDKVCYSVTLTQAE